MGWDFGFVQLYQEGVVEKLDFGDCSVSEEVEDVGFFVIGVFYCFLVDGRHLGYYYLTPKRL